MALNLKNPEVDKLAAEVARLAGESKTEAVRLALLERRRRLRAARPGRPRGERFFRYLAQEVWPKLPPGRRRLTRKEEDAILGYGPEGV